MEMMKEIYMMMKILQARTWRISYQSFRNIMKDYFSVSLNAMIEVLGIDDDELKF
jgi:hypothetical protein